MLTAKLQEIRKRVGLSQSQLAAQMGVDTSLISRWEKGEREPSFSQQMDLARLLGVSVDYLVNGKLEVDFLLRAKVSKADEKKPILQALTDAEQQINFIEAAHRMAGKQPKPFLLSVDLTAYQYGDAAKLVRGLLNLNERVTLDELKQALTEQNVYVFSWHMPPQLSGVSYRENFAAIFVNAGQTPERQLFTLTHEAVHLICHLRPCPPGDEDKKNASVSLASARSDPQEKEANRLSAEILMPAPLVEHLWKETGARVGDGRKRSFYLGMLARFFNVSRDAMFYRLAELGRLAWSDKKKFVGQFVSDAWETQPRVREIKDQVAPELLTLGLELYGSDEVTAGKLAEWFATSRRRVEEYLSDIEREESSSAELAADFEE